MWREEREGQSAREPFVPIYIKTARNHRRSTLYIRSPSVRTLYNIHSMAWHGVHCTPNSRRINVFTFCWILWRNSITTKSSIDKNYKYAMLHWIFNTLQLQLAVTQKKYNKWHLRKWKPREREKCVNRHTRYIWYGKLIYLCVRVDSFCCCVDHVQFGLAICVHLRTG